MTDAQSEVEYFTASNEPEIVTVGPATFLSIAGTGPPGSNAFYAKKRRLVQAAAALGIEGFVQIMYWFDPEFGEVGIARFYWTVPLEHLRYRILVRVPSGTTLPVLDTLPADLADGLELFTTTEGEVVQVMHHGPFADEAATLDRLGAFATSRGLRRSGPHHEIHLDDFEPGVPQDGFRTILRDPVGA